MSADRTTLLARLDAIGLPHATELGALVARFGITRSRWYDWDVVAYEGAQPLVPGQIGPFEQNQRPMPPDRLPPAWMSAFVAPTDDARANHAHALASLSAWLGPPRESATSNTLGHVWQLDSARVRITTWPPDLERTPLASPAHARHPEMRAFTHLFVEPGHVVPLSSGERAALGAIVPLGAPESARPAIAGLDQQMMRGTLRWLPPESARAARIGTSPSGDAIVGVDGRVALVVPRDLVRGVTLTHLTPARGGGGDELSVSFEDAWTSARTLRRQTILHGALDALEGAARTLAQRAGVALATESFPDE